jgi:iron complex outermembrane receptor protein
MYQGKGFLGAAVFVAGVITSSVASAQDAGGAPVLEEVVVTAEKRSVNLQEVPKQVQVVSTEQLKNSNVTGLSDLVKLVPSLSGPNTNAMGGQTSMRGVGTAAPSLGAPNKVGIVLDDVPIPARASAVRNILDIQQVEVLPGPQGTLAGRNASGGLINLVTRKPSRTDFVGIFQASGTRDHEYTAGAYISDPINDRLAFSLSANYQFLRGLAYNVALDKWNVDANSLSFRGKLLWEVQEDSELTFSWAHSRDKTEGGGTGGWSSIYRQIDVPLNTITSALEIVPTGTAKKTFTQLLPGITPSPDNVSYYSIDRAEQTRTNDTGILRYEQKFTPGSFVAIASYLDEKYPQLQDWLNYPDVNLDLRPEFDGYAHIQNRSVSKTLEARFASNTDQAWTYLVGAFWSDTANRYEYQRYQQPFWADRRFGSDSAAAFASTSYTFPSRTTVRAGMRYEKDDIDYSWTYLDIPATTRTLQNGIVRNFARVFFPATSAQSNDDFVNFDLGLQQKLGNEAMVYLNYAEANQGPLYDAEDITGSQLGRPLDPLPPEEVKSIEIGLKSTFFNRRLILNLNAFDMRFENYQALTNVTDTANPSAQPILKTWSAGKVTSRGVELTSSALLGDRFRLDLAGMYNDAFIKEWFNAPCFSNQTAAEGCIMGAIPPGEFVVRNYQADISGNRLANAPKYKLTAIGTYTNNLGFAPAWEYSASLTGRYLSKQIGDQLGAPATQLPATTYVDANLSFTRDNLQLAIFGVNLFEEFAEGFGTGLGAGLSSSLGGASTGRQPDGSYPIKTRTLSRDNVRYLGARVSYRF